MNDTAPSRCSVCTWLALLAAAAGVAGSLWLSLGMGLLACPLCYYQRTFMMAALGVLVAGLIGGVRPSAWVSLLALPAAIGGLGVAGYHVSLEMAGEMVCPAGIFDLGTAPQQSLGIFALLTLLLACDICRGCCCSADGTGGRGLLGGLMGIALGLAFSYGCIQSAAMIPLPEELKTGDIKICRKAPPAKS